MGTVITKMELAKLMMINRMHFDSYEHAQQHIGASYPKYVNLFFNRSNKYYIDFFSHFGYDIKLLIANDNSKFLIS